ncbi:MAG: hypothetical protein A3C79_01885 [Candidatus Taylorbacteria bacterium RIFCSPHIGHO2_02_FULL_45_28]|uniref:Toxin HicA n=1 Tax=Candidatus Taylorbacteria bacterium RIFCSPHIGHO2_12_FULL_45_16 TaxID=1802315 RepID=A0A1G2N035_9BACT|nr:MAG: hypothetical protein A2830_02690 [Candidatus Taylorbacteria bacterium RIFCSPHIGHO2_01_FULL_44_110]OHA25200.1 MAG: hypothetical protein A3C79_01885 [Candidatus Taylorbacteria bacterium RIFCSPHIGHO2_02_FULL_45_28]OHA29444.1 MAG: hypothetical protein A3F51_00195 [Candidatus Taylorbacteria bacterium RIFCSPHIGHO2_12_FULL_45_16]OHA33206.1 MAG: hypothetical protein A3A23_02725 [Candidatus Taylorbacteria bacterium RIFCSPLOWO2_01_FULL_45_59]OHA38259.1 MAG: hypothetical protein A3I98_02990 [Candi
MPKGAFNWTFNDVVAVLKENGFHLNHIKGSHYFYVGYIDGKARQVCVAKHGKISFKPRTFKGMMEQSGLSRDKWGL